MLLLQRGATACMRACVVACVIDTMYQLIYTSAQTKCGESNFRINIFEIIGRLQKDELGGLPPERKYENFNTYYTWVTGMADERETLFFVLNLGPRYVKLRAVGGQIIFGHTQLHVT